MHLSYTQPITSSNLVGSTIILADSSHHEEYIERWKSGLESGITSPKYGETSRHIHRYIKDKYNNSCSRCGWNEEHPLDGRVPVELEHIDGDWRNNKENNLTLLCPNCHSLTPTYRSRNRGKGRPGKVGVVYRKKF